MKQESEDSLLMIKGTRIKSNEDTQDRRPEKTHGNI